MTSPYLYMLAGAFGYAVLTAIYRRVYDATSRDVDALAKSNQAQSQTIGALRVENAALRALVVQSGLIPPDGPVLSNEEEILAEIARGRKINAIKLYRESAGVGLKEAKDAVEAMAVAAHRGALTVTADVPVERIANLVRAGNKIAAIRDYRAATGVTLHQAMDYVEELARTLK